MPAVLAAHEGTIEALHSLKPPIVVIAGEYECDPHRE
jgi:hypothetical protein